MLLEYINSIKLRLFNLRNFNSLTLSKIPAKDTTPKIAAENFAGYTTHGREFDVQKQEAIKMLTQLTLWTMSV